MLDGFVSMSTFVCVISSICIWATWFINGNDPHRVENMPLNDHQNSACIYMKGLGYHKMSIGVRHCTIDWEWYFKPILGLIHNMHCVGINHILFEYPFGLFKSSPLILTICTQHRSTTLTYFLSLHYYIMTIPLMLLRVSLSSIKTCTRSIIDQFIISLKVVYLINYQCRFMLLVVSTCPHLNNMPNLGYRLLQT